MQIKVSGKQIDVGDALTVHVEERMTSEVGKYFDRPMDGSVTFSRNAHGYRCDASTHLPTGLHVQATAKANEIYSAFDQCVERIAKQLRRYKRRLKDHHQAREVPIEMFAAPSYVLASEAEDADDEPTSLEPVIIAEMTQDIKSLTVGEAVMQMEFSDAPFLMFRHQATGRVNLVFRRDDGNIGWVDPADRAKA